MAKTNRVSSVVLRAALVVAVAAAVEAGALIVAGMRYDARPSDVAIVMGAGVDVNCKPSDALTMRLDEADRLYKEGKFPHIIVSGGKSTKNTNLPNESKCMHDYLVANGVASSIIEDDPGGVHSAETAHNSAAIMRKKGWRSVVIITHYYHVPRTQLAFLRCGVTQVTRAPVGYPRWENGWEIFREVVGYPAYLLGYRYFGGEAASDPVRDCPEHLQFPPRPAPAR